MCAIVVVVCCPLEAFADPAYSSFGPGDSFNAISRWSVGDFAGVYPNAHRGFLFTSQMTGVLFSIEVAASTPGPNGLDEMEWILWSDIGGTPDSFIWSGTVNPPNHTASVLTIMAGTGAPILTAGTDYWLSARSVNAVNFYGWHLNDQTIIASSVFDPNGGTSWEFSSEVQGAFRVNVGIPEPSSLLAILACGTSLIFRRGR